MTLNLQSPAVVAFLRGIFLSLIAAGAVYFEADTDPWRAAGTAFFAAMGIRFGVEGAWDTVKNRNTVRVPAAADGQPALPEPRYIDPEDDFHYGSQDGKEHRGKTPAVCNICVIDNGG